MIKVTFTFIILLCVQGLRFHGVRNAYKFLTNELLSIFNSEFSEKTITKWINQPLDHFDSYEKRTWPMRVMERLDFWKDRGPIIIFLGGESEAHPIWFELGMFHDLANETSGAMYMTEHRYYGMSLPLNDSSIKSLQYLSSRQALADVAFFLKEVKSRLEFRNSKVVVMGGSYAGNLAAWMRLLYPDLVDMAISSSAPVLAKKDFFEYLEKVYEDYVNYGSKRCIKNIHEKFKKYESMFKSDVGINQLLKEENICDYNNMKNIRNKYTFFSSKIVPYMSHAQYGSPDSIKKHCDNILHNDTKLELLPYWKTNLNCFSYEYDELIDYIKSHTDYNSWMYQVCTEFGYFQTTTSENHIFTNNVPLDYNIGMCVDLFGSEFNEITIDEAISITNRVYEGRRPNVTKVVFVNGDMDPWSTLGVLEDISYDAPAKIISRVSHCSDLLPERRNDQKDLIEARKLIKYLIKKWIAAEYNRE